MALANAQTYQVAHVRVLVIEDHGGDLIVELDHRRGGTRCQIDKAQLVGVCAETAPSKME
jgi:hypothetical protein